jgi:hypothetical protein
MWSMENEETSMEPEPDAGLAALARRREGRGPTGRARTSKIARLPAGIREELNERLLDGEEPGGIVAWLNSLPAVQRVLARSFAAQPITEVNLSRWRQGGYARWLEHRNTQEAVEAVAASCAGVDGGAAERLSRHLSVVLSARLIVEAQKCGTMPEGPDKTAAWQQLLMAHVLLRRADFYGAKARQELEKAAIAEERQRARGEENRAFSPEEIEEATNNIMGTGRFAANWNNFTKKWEGPGAAMRYEEEEVTRRVREEMKRRYPNGFPEGYSPPYGDPLPV